jgi:hypothetical protein
MVYVYDGVIPRVTLRLNGFNVGAYFINLLFKVITHDNTSWTDGYINTFCNCNTGLIMDQSSTELQSIICSYNVDGLVVQNSSSLTFRSDSYTNVFQNNKGKCLYINNSICESKISYDYSRQILLHNNSTGLFLANNSSMIGRGLWSYYNYYGMLIRSSAYRSFSSIGDDLSGKPKLLVENCYYGINAYESAFLYTRNMQFSGNTKEAILVQQSTYINDVYTTNFYYNGIGIHAIRSTAEIDHVYIQGTSGKIDGIEITQSYAEITNSTIRDYPYKGVYWLESQGRMINNKIYDNDKGIFVKTSRVRLTNSSNYNVNNNDTRNIECYAGGQIFIYTDDDITNTVPAANGSLDTSGYNSLQFIGKSVY